MKSLFGLFRKPKQHQEVIIVSGLPRSGTSMMMKMLDAGGIPPMTDNIRTADIENPKGYYEYERVKKMPEGDTAWLADAGGKAVKVISALLEHLPKDYDYKVVFMRRAMPEILASQKQMLVRSNKPTDTVSDEKLAELYEKHIEKIDAWLADQPNFRILYVDYNQMLANPRSELERINAFFNSALNMDAMLQVVDPQLYRQRTS